MIWKRRKKSAAKPEPASLVSLRSIKSERMLLVAASLALVEADLARGALLADMLEAHVPDNWPPELYDHDAMRYARQQLSEPAMEGWSFWYLLLVNDSAGHHQAGQDHYPAQQLAGICGFKGRPDAAGSVEIGYSVLAQYRNQGLATEAVDRLVRWAFSHQNVIEVSAETLPHLQASIRVMKKNGFSHTGAGSERGVIRYAVERPDRRRKA